MGEDYMPGWSRITNDLLGVFDVDEDDKDFLTDTIIPTGGQHHHEFRDLLGQSLEAGADEWRALIECARTMRQLQLPPPESLRGNDTLTYVWEVLRLQGIIAPPEPQPWQETDRLIALAKRLEQPRSANGQEQHVQTCGSGAEPWQDTDRLIALAKALERSEDETSVAQHDLAGPPKVIGQVQKGRKAGSVATSHYWADPEPRNSHASSQNRSQVLQDTNNDQKAQSCRPQSACADRVLLAVRDSERDRHQPPVILQDKPLNEINLLTRKNLSSVSPYFANEKPSPEKIQTLQKRPRPGTVSCLAFPPLDSSSFGLVQEKLATEPFWLLIAVTFLIKTKGSVAIPVLYAVKERFPTPKDLADTCNAAEILAMIRHLGLAMNRLAFIQRYAKAFMEDPPRAGKVYRVRNYDHRDLPPPPVQAVKSAQTTETPASRDNEERQVPDAWEIGHMTKGKYAIDSWRIFCRDVLLRRAQDWNGKNREPEFQPEWMRVRPDDKELRALLRWMWMREGWEWDPSTGERKVLRAEMQRAVDEGRVEYDDRGDLVIVEEPR